MSENVKHTPGPWIAKWSKYREGVFIVQAGMPSNRVLASFDGDGDGPDDQSLADARLIASAPTLAAENAALKALVAEMVEGLEALANESDRIGTVLSSKGIGATIMGMATNRARALIARAKEATS
jgi:hypothetical protein